MSMIKIEVNGLPVDVVAGSTVIQACQKLGFSLPRYCYDERLLIAGNCRMCLVEVMGSPKPQVACALPVSPNMKVFTESPRAKKARELVTDFLLIHHPLDCPICDQGGECDLQDQTFTFGSDRSRYYYAPKRGVEDKDFGPIVGTAMTRCIHCTRCVRYMSETAGVPVLGTIGRGSNTEIGTYIDGVMLESEVAGNVADLCPVGALTSKPTANAYRAWEFQTLKTFDVTDPGMYELVAHVSNNKVQRLLPIKDRISNGYSHDKARYVMDSLDSSYHITEPAMIEVGDHSTYMMGVDWDWSRRMLESFTSYDRSDRLSTRLEDPSISKMAMFSYDSKPLKRDVNSSVRVLDVVLSSNVSLDVMSFWTSVRTKLEASGFGKWLNLQVLSPSLSPSTGVHSHVEDSMFDFKALMESDMVIVVGMDLRSDAPLINMTLRDKFLRNAAKVFLVGGHSDFTYPVLQSGVSVQGLIELRDLSRPEAKDIYSCKRPMILVSGTVLRRPDGAAIMDVLRSWADMMKYSQGSLESEKDKERRIPMEWKVLNVHHRSGGAFGAHQLGIAPFKGYAPMTSVDGRRPLLVTIGLTSDDLMEGNWGLPQDGCYQQWLMLTPFVDRNRDHVKVFMPVATHREEQGHYIGLDGEVRMMYPTNMKTTESSSYKSFLTLLEAFFPAESLYFNSLVKTSFDSIVGDLAKLSIPSNGKEAVSSVKVVEEKVLKTAELAVEPSVYDYYTEGHTMTRYSDTMLKCYDSYEALHDEVMVDKEYQMDGYSLSDDRATGFDFVEDLDPEVAGFEFGSGDRTLTSYVGAGLDERGSDLTSIGHYMTMQLTMTVPYGGLKLA